MKKKKRLSVAEQEKREWRKIQAEVRREIAARCGRWFLYEHVASGKFICVKTTLPYFEADILNHPRLGSPPAAWRLVGQTSIDPQRGRPCYFGVAPHTWSPTCLMYTGEGHGPPSRRLKEVLDNCDAWPPFGAAASFYGQASVH